jgi:acetylornithine deacetylase/succinyl-diaminopimelate desuccinylase-like protein
MSRIEEYVKSKRKETLQELLELLSIPSISSNREHGADMARCAQVVAARLADAGFEAEVMPTGGHPAVYGERMVARERSTLLIYGHYDVGDVQPPGPIQTSKHAPFEPVVDGDAVTARGASDNKSHFYALLKGLQAFCAIHDDCPVNVKVLIDGEKEIGSPSLEPLLRSNASRFSCDSVVMADGNQLLGDVPAITYGLRGLVGLEVVVRGPAEDLCSGHLDGAVANPANALSRILAACQGPFGRVAVPGFYEAVRELDPREREEYSRLSSHEEALLKTAGVIHPWGEEGYSTLERSWARPSFEISSLATSVSSEAGRTGRPARASARISLRLVPDQDPAAISRLTREFLQSMAPPGVALDIREHHRLSPVLLPREGPFVRAAVKAHVTAFGREPLWIRRGGSSPLVHLLLDKLGAPILLLGLGVPDGPAQAPVERIPLQEVYRRMVLMGSLLEELGG